MKLISWNCNGAFRRKHMLLAKWQPDVMVIPESESPDDLVYRNSTIPCDWHFWEGTVPYRGMSVFFQNGYRAKVADFYNEKYSYIIPFEITHEDETFLLFAVWTKYIVKHSNSYIVQAYKAFDIYKKYFNEKTIIIGDFNSNKQWDNLFKRNHNHSSTMAMLEKKSMRSVYHEKMAEQQGKETTPTIYMYRQKEMTYHIDYAFVHQDRLSGVKNFSIGDYDNWGQYSDHMPLFLEIE